MARKEARWNVIQSVPTCVTYFTTHSRSSSAIMSRKSSIPSTTVIFGDNPSFDVDPSADSSPCDIPVNGSIMLLLEEDTRSLVNVGLLRKELGRHVGTFRSGTKPSHLIARKATMEMKSLDIFLNGDG